MSRILKQTRNYTALVAIGLLATVGTVRAETILSITQTSYDANDRPVCSVIRMDTASAETDACTPRQSTNGPDRVTKTVYDADGNVTDVIRAFGIVTPAFTENLQQTYAHYGYTLNGKKADETDANGNKTSLTYDKFDRLEWLVYPSTTTPGVSNTNDKEVYTYDPNGNRASFTRRGGQVYTYEYDALNRQTLKTRSDNAGLNVISRYDLMGRLITAAFQNGSGTITNSYDKLGRQLTTKDVNDRTISYQYDEASRRTYLTYPDTTTTVQQKYEYNTAGMLTWTGLADGSVKVTPGYDPQGRVTSVARTNGANTTLEYDDLDRLAKLVQDMNGSDKDIDWGFTRNQASQIVNWSATSTVYDYVQTQSKPDNRTYNGLNQDAGIAATENNTGYDLNGNLQKDGTRTFGYDIDNHLISVGGIATGTLEYDPLGRLSKTTFGSTVTSFLYDGVNLIGEYNSPTATTIQIRYLHALGDDQPFAQFAGSLVAAGNAKYLIANYQGSIMALADSSGNVSDADLYKYGPWGEPKSTNNTDQWSGSRFRYTGQTILPELKLYYYKARVYDPILGRFLQTDPIGSEDDLDLYAYVAGDPINKSDPDGKFGITFTVEGFIAKTCGKCDGAFGAAGIGVGFDKKGNLEVSVITSTGAIKEGEGGGLGASAGIGFYTGDAKGMEENSDTAGAMAGVVGGSTSYNGDKNGLPTGKGPASGPVPITGKVLGKTLAKAATKVSATVGLGVYHTKPTTKVRTAKGYVKSENKATKAQVCRSVTGRSRPKYC